MSLTIRLYEHENTRARVEGSIRDRETMAYGWDYTNGDTVEVDGDYYKVSRVYSSIQTDDSRGNYIRADLVRA